MAGKAIKGKHRSPCSLSGVEHGVVRSEKFPTLYISQTLSAFLFLRCTHVSLQCRYD